MGDYLGTKVMRATSGSMALASSVLELDIVELWHDDGDGVLKCAYVHCKDKLKDMYPQLVSVISGHFPQHTKEHKVSPKLCRESRIAPKRVYWKTTAPDGEDEGSEDENSPAPQDRWHSQINAPIRTEMSYFLEAETSGVDIFIVGFAIKRIEYSESKIKFLSGLGYAIYIAAFDLDDDERLKSNDTEELLDIPEPRPLMRSMSIASVSDLEPEIVDTVVPKVATPRQNMETPVWVSSDPFAFPVAQLPICNEVPSDLNLEQFSGMKHIADGSNSNVFLGRWKGEVVVIKMIKQEAETNEVANFEFDIEHGTLCRLNHDGVIKILGSGRKPRRFLVLEYLAGGALTSKLSNPKSKPGLAGKLFKRPPFTYPVLLSLGLQVARTMHYLHSQIYPGAVLIHRDLKPDNIGFTADGKIKLFDFGLCSFVKTRSSSEEAYLMTGNTGSLRYMAPEVARKEAYNELVDVYSFGIILWQMARDKMPYKGVGRDEFVTGVAYGNLRPKLDSSWPKPFNQLLCECWHANPPQRPLFSQIVNRLQQMLMEVSKGKPRRSLVL